MSGLSGRNPYVGPRPIQQGEPLYGRKSEVRELFNLLQARRIVVLHSPSGAGKSSLVEAGLIPRLTDAKFDVWRTIRVNLDPHGLVGIPPGTNRYLLSAMVSLEEELPAERRRSPARLAGLSFAEYLRTRPRRKAQADCSVALIFDQFEELLTTAPLALAEKAEFFTAVGEGLAAERYWALIVVREDFLGAFAPYRDRIPTHLANTFRLDLLGLDGAREAIELPARAAGRAFPAVDRLVRDLSMIQVQRVDGTFVAEQGLYVEPVQLQVVCHRLWDAMPDDALSIDEEHVTRDADVSTALADYYAGAVKKASRGDAAVERRIREWVGGKLIVGGIRSQVRQGAGRSAGLDNREIAHLLDSYLVRADQRAGAHWYELSHDRLVEPIQLDNKAWEVKNLHPLQVQARLWDDSHRPRALLLGTEALRSAQTWARANPALLTEGEREFLDQSRDLQARKQAARRRLVILTVVVGMLAVVALVARQSAEAARAEAETARAEAETATAAAVAAGEDALRQRDAAKAAEERAVVDRGAAKQAAAQAVTARKENDKLLEATFRAALRSFLDSLAKEGSLAGEVTVNERWTPLLGRKGQHFAASLVREEGGRIIVAGHDAVLGVADRQGYSVFLALTSKWLLSGRDGGVIAISSDTDDSALLGKLKKNLTTLEYGPTTTLDRLADAGMLILANRREAFTTAEVAAIRAFLGRGGGVLAVGVGWSWRPPKPKSGQGPPTLDSYPMNQLLREYGAQWNDKKIEGLEKADADDPDPGIDQGGARSEQCKFLLDRINKAKLAKDFRGVLNLIRNNVNVSHVCWTKSDYAKLEIQVYMELRRFNDCVAAGADHRDPEVVKWVEYCERRGKPE